MDGLRGIATSNELRLYPILKRIGQGELILCHHPQARWISQGPREALLHRPVGRPFLCLACAAGRCKQANVERVCRVGTGVRLKCGSRRRTLICAGYGMLRFRTLLNRINDALTWQNQPPFVPWTISRIEDFICPQTLNVEDEVRPDDQAAQGRSQPDTGRQSMSIGPSPSALRIPFVRLS